MDICSTLNAPRRCRLGGKTFWVRSLSIEGMACVLAWLDDVLPGRSERTMPPEFGSQEAQEALRSWPGRFMLSWLAVRDSGISYDDVALLAYPDPEKPGDDERADLEHVRILDVLFASRRTAAKSDGEKRDVATTWCQAGMAALIREMGAEAVGKLSFDQFEWLMSDGEVDTQAQPAHAVTQNEVVDLLATAKVNEVAPEVIAAYEAAVKAYAASQEVADGPAT